MGGGAEFRELPLLLLCTLFPFGPSIADPHGEEEGVCVRVCGGGV